MFFSEAQRFFPTKPLAPVTKIFISLSHTDYTDGADFFVFLSHTDFTDNTDSFTIFITDIEDIFDYTDSNRGCFTDFAQSIYYSANTSLMLYEEKLVHPTFRVIRQSCRA